MTSGTRHSLVMGAICSVVGLAVGGSIALQASGSGYEWFAVYSGSAAFLTAAGLWRLLIERAARYRIASGALVGGLSGILAHPLNWYLLIASSRIDYLVTGGSLSSLGDPPMDLWSGLAGSLVLSFWSLLIFGWLTVPAGSLIGGSYCWYLQRKRSA